MSLEFDQQVWARLAGPIATLAAGTQTPFPTGELKTGRTWADSLLHGTTIGAFVIEDGQRAVCFSDGKVSMGNTPVHLHYRKMANLDPHTVMLFSGSPTLAVQHTRTLRNWFGYREETTNEPMTARAKALALADVLLHGINLAHAGILLAPIMATYDGRKRHVRLFNFGPEGSMTEDPDFTTSGSGMMVRHIVGKLWKKGMTRDDGVALARQLILEEIKKVDSASGGSVSIDIVGPDGTETVQE